MVDIINLISDTLFNLLMIAHSKTLRVFRVCEQVTMNESFLEYFVDVDGMFGKYYLTHGTKYLVT
jgi:hypothetical protein